MHSNAFLFTEGRWHSFNSACAFNRSIVYSILRILNNEKYIFFKPQGEALSLKEIAKGDFLARFEPVGLHLRSVETHYISQFCSQEIETDSHFGYRVQDLLFRKAGPQLLVYVIDGSH